MSIGLVIPSKNAGARWIRVIEGIQAQRGGDLDILVIDSGSSDQTVTRATEAGLRVIEIPPTEFGHGTTRQKALEWMQGHKHVVYMTQDAILATPDSIRRLVLAFEDDRVAVAYGRQLPHEDATVAARRLRDFNYPDQSFLRSYSDRHLYGFKTTFNSNSFAAYDRERLLSVGGFPTQALVGEDVLACAALLRAGFCSAYVAEAKVFHSHNYSMTQEFVRYQTIGQMHAMFSDLLRDFGRPEGEGLRLVKREVSQALLHSPLQIPGLLTRSAVRYLGYQFGRYRSPHSKSSRALT